VGSLIGGECQSCAGQMAFPLRDGRGRFLTTKTTDTTETTGTTSGREGE